DIDDEYDDADKNYARINASNYLFEAKIPLGDFFRITDIDSEEFEKDAGEAETLGGFILELQGEIPVQETEIDYKNYRFKIVSADKRRIKTIKFTILNPDAKSE
ncbi:MAG: hemolysin, partial [Paludibacteraceae bacterium]|nr:hemolysin [Paludibacteraceae bacterium]